MNIDEFGLVVGTKEDPGDSLHRTMMFMLASWWFETPRFGEHYVDITFKHFECSKNHYCRHPSTGWWSECDRLSRDQATPLVIAMGEFGHARRLKCFLWEHIKRFGFFTNTRRNGATPETHGVRKWPKDPVNTDVHNYNWKLPDIISLEFIGIYIRAINAWPLYPILWFLDLETVIGSIIWRFKDEQTDILNHIIICEYATRKYPTPLSRLAKRINNKQEFRKKLDHYFNRVGLPILGKLWQL